MLKIFAPKSVDRVIIGNIKNVKIARELEQAKGVMNNYLRDKHFTVGISDSNLQGDDFLDIEGFADSKKSISLIPIKIDDKEHFLRKIYRVIEAHAKDPGINTKK